MDDKEVMRKYLRKYAMDSDQKKSIIKNEDYPPWWDEKEIDNLIDLCLNRETEIDDVTRLVLDEFVGIFHQLNMDFNWTNFHRVKLELKKNYRSLTKCQKTNNLLEVVAQNLSYKQVAEHGNFT